MAKAVNWVNVFLTILVIIGICLVGLSACLDTFVTSRIEWIWLAVAGIGLSSLGASLMKN